MSLLNKFHFNIRSTIALYNQINLQSNEDIQLDNINLIFIHIFEHEFFLRIAQSFPLVKALTLVNMKPQNGKQTDDNQNLPIIEYAHLTTLDLTKSHLDYIEQFLLDTKTTLPSNVHLSVVYQALRKVTQNLKVMLHESIVRN
ncbi:unnamed protein product [Rotaria socialis]|uniref:Uncharacterized protein n=1 Tax=Rotaria socialis TaxID=392032 RepID=A0A817R7B0_9BILA|nr:unnamed protein product [Rotaria socialis]